MVFSRKPVPTEGYLAAASISTTPTIGDIWGTPAPGGVKPHRHGERGPVIGAATSHLRPQ
jgi:hypothetical protein